ncbi:alpha/beta hydrolase [Nocardioides sp. GY 10113]|uniref:alpha/beta hydrolase n=1 Tax=Nocardioides sp. GY 10113 TaxID=2569761 RepID=UPI0010A89BBA|nr:alpha/beta hydrolase [Nocardioides sp. GY 10113]TIC83898.1 alpha/beta hydrolase [Nocardioides sp. GY 10113]
MGFVGRQLLTAALTANAIRPLSGFRTGIPAFFAGWLTGELAPHLLGLTVADAALHATGRRRDTRGLALAGASAAGLAYLIRQSRQVGAAAEEALTEGLGIDYAEQLDAAPTPADLATPWRSIANPFAYGRARRRAGVQVLRDVAYDAAHGKRGLLDIYTSTLTPASGAPVLLQVHGGAWTIGEKEQQGLPLMQHLAAKGWVCVAINYRLAPRSPWPAQIVDVKAAIAWVRANIAEYGGDPDYVVITGGSAGGHLTALAALTANDPAFQPGFEDADTTVQAAVPHYGVYDLAGATGIPRVLQTRDRFLAPKVMQTSFADSPEVFEAASPLLRVTEDAPDFFVLHGASDTLVDVRQARAFVARLRETSRRSVVYAELPGAQHAFDLFPSIRSAHVVRAIDRYLHWHWNTHRASRGSGTAEPGLRHRPAGSQAQPSRG